MFHIIHPCLRGYQTSLWDEETFSHTANDTLNEYRGVHTLPRWVCCLSLSRSCVLCCCWRRCVWRDPGLCGRGSERVLLRGLWCWGPPGVRWSNWVGNCSGTESRPGTGQGQERGKIKHSETCNLSISIATVLLMCVSHLWAEECGPVRRAPGWWPAGEGSAAPSDPSCSEEGRPENLQLQPSASERPSERGALRQPAHTQWESLLDASKKM